jgi:hypothetical protein
MVFLFQPGNNATFTLQCLISPLRLIKKQIYSQKDNFAHFLRMLSKLKVEFLKTPDETVISVVQTFTEFLKY